MTEDERRRVRELAHELNNHLTAIRLTAEICERKLEDRERVERGLRELRRLGEQATQAANELLALGRASPT